MEYGYGWMQVWRFEDGFTEKDFYLPHTLASLPQPYLYLLHVQFRINPFIMMASEVDGNMNSVVEFLNFEKLLIWPHLFKKPHFIITSRSIFEIGMHVWRLQVETTNS